MNGLDIRQRDSEVPRSENMIQYAFKEYNKSNDLMESIKRTPEIYGTVNKAVLEYKAEKNKEKVNPQTPIVTAQDIIDEMYR